MQGEAAMGDTAAAPTPENHPTTLGARVKSVAARVLARRRTLNLKEREGPAGEGSTPRLDGE